MKTLITILFCIALFSCSSEDPAPKDYKSLLGDWEVKTERAEAKFSVIVNNVMDTVVAATGYFKLDGDRHEIDFESVFVQEGSIAGLTVISLDESVLSFYNTEFNQNFTEITAEGYFFTNNGEYVEVAEAVRIKRK